MAKLNGSQIRQARALFASGHSVAEIQRRWLRHVGTTGLSDAIFGNTWKHLPDICSRRGHTRGRQCHLAKLTDAKVRMIRRLYQAGASSPKLAQRFDVSESTILNVVHRVTWKHVD